MTYPPMNGPLRIAPRRVHGAAAINPANGHGCRFGSLITSSVDAGTGVVMGALAHTT